MNDQQMQGKTVGTDVRIQVPWSLIQEVPEQLRSDQDQLEEYLIRAMEIGLKAMAQAGITLDTDFVRHEFHQFSANLNVMRDGLQKLMAEELTAEDSKLAKCLRDYLADEGRLARTVRALSSELGDPQREGSIPGRIRTLLDETFKHANSPFQRALNIGDDSSPQGSQNPERDTGHREVLIGRNRIQSLRDINVFVEKVGKCSAEPRHVITCVL